MECQIENPDGIKFYGDFGEKLKKICRDCDFTNPQRLIFATVVKKSYFHLPQRSRKKCHLMKY